MTNIYKFKVDSVGKLLYYQGKIVCEDAQFISINDRFVGLVRINKSKIVSQERCQK